MIITKIIGGLGNQMFQYAAGRRAAYVNDTSLKLDITGYENQVGITPREYMLDIFNIQENFASKDEIRKLKKSSFILRFFKKNTYVKEKHFHFDQNILDINDNSYLEGYWVSEKYFKDIEKIIREDFTFKYPLDKKSQLITDKIKNSNSISIHIRRGDYVSDLKTTKIHGICSSEYYEKAISAIKNRVKKPVFYIFSDDLQWTKQNIRLEFPCVYVDHNLGKKDYEDMRLMSECKHNIIANSSFSWWGAWLNKNKNKIVIAPRRFFRKSSINTKDLIPKSWIRI